MTLHTRMAILTPVNARELFDFTRSLLGVPLDEQRENPEEATYYDPGTFCLSNRMGQGFAAAVDLDYAVERPIQPMDEDYDSEYSYFFKDSPVFAYVHWDTGYAYRDHGCSCSDLHAAFIAEVAFWIDSRVDSPTPNYAWYDEYRGEWHLGLDKLDDFGNRFKVDLSKLGRD